ncbi:MAG: fibronectin type III domain-containing protein [Fimbriimonas sp.]|nr:fibronectin type III domain-containing protein [Fimbriimonas sp.]
MLKSAMTLLAGGLIAVCSSQVVSTTNGNVRLNAVSSKAFNQFEVRLRWQFIKGWVPANGIRLYRIQGSAKSLVVASKSIDDSALPQKVRSRGFIASAKLVNPISKELSFLQPSRVSAAPLFARRQQLVKEIESLDSTLLTKNQRDVKAQKISELGRLNGPVAKRPQVKALSTKDLTFEPRASLTLMSFLKPDLAQSLCLGATDRTMQPNETVSYELYEATSAGGDGKLLVKLPDFNVGPGSGAPAIGGPEFIHEEDKIRLRWNRFPVELENTLLAVSYLIQRKGPELGSQAFEPLTEEPLIILDGPEGREPIWFFQDQIAKPGLYTYEIRAVDGFGRISSPVSLTVPAKDWRKPAPPRSAGSTLSGKPKRFKPRSSGFEKFNAPTDVLSGVGRTVSIGWQSQVAPAGLQLRYNIYRVDLDNPEAAPSLLNPSPVEGVPISVGTEEQFLAALDLVMGESYLDEQERQILAAERSAEQSTGDARKAAIISAAKTKAMIEMGRKALKTSWSQNPPRSFLSTGTEVNRRYRFFVKALYVSTGLESAEAPAGVVNLPDPVAPAAPGSVAISFKATIATSAGAKPSASPRPFSAPSAPFSQLRNNLTNFNPLKGKAPVTLNIPTKDSGGRATITWAAVPGQINPVYSIERKSGNEPFVEVGMTPSNANSFTDFLPRSRSKVYTYRVSTISRWNIKGAGKEVVIEAPSTIAPDAPNLLSVRPTGDKELTIKVSKPPADQGVIKVILLRDGQQVAEQVVPSDNNSSFTYSDKNLQPGREYLYAAIAATTAGLKSMNSMAMKAKALRMRLTAPINFSASASSRGVALSWAPVPDAAFYIISRTSGTETPEIISSDVKGGTFLDHTTLAGKSYRYSIIAVDTFGNQSVAASITTQTP